MTSKLLASVFLAFTISILSGNIHAQGIDNIWYFGAQAGVTFSSGSPVALTNCSSSFAAFEGVGTACDVSGNLRFYTDGFTIFNKNHVAMQNGTGLTSNSSATQTGLCVKQPGNDSIYYVFHNDLINEYYSTVDIEANGGLGVVLQKNILLRTNVTEKATAVTHANGTDIWVILKDLGNSTWPCFKLTSAGLNLTPVTSNCGLPYNNSIGYLKASPQADKLADADFYLGSYSIYDFDNATGIVSNVTTSPSVYVYPYGIEWSPDGTKLYGGAENSNDLYQFDVSAGPNVWNTATLIYETASIEFEALQLGPDGKIYCSLYTATHMGVINYPNLAGAACGYVDNGPSLSGRSCYLGLPNYNQSIFNPNTAPQSAFSASDTDVCQKFCVNYFDESANDPTSWSWTFEGGSPSTSILQNPTGICYNTPGSYDVTLITSNGNNADTLVLANFMTVNATPALPTITQNGYVLTSSPASAYQWQLNSVDIPGATMQSYTVTQTGYYTVIISMETGCKSSNTLYVSITGIDDAFFAAGFSIFPNPSNGNFVINYSGTEISGDASIEVVNALGQVLFHSEEQISSVFNKNIKLSNPSAGIYFLVIRTESKSLRQKIILTD